MVLYKKLLVRLTTLIVNKNRCISFSVQQQPAATVKSARNVFQRHPLISNVGICVGFGALGDFIEQLRENWQNDKEIIPNWDKTRTVKFAGASVSVGVICHYWYNFLDKRFVELTWQNVVKKIVLCQLVHSPLCIAAFFISIGYLNSWSRDEIVKNIYEKGLLVYEAEWIIWPPALLFNFYFLPTRYRVLFDSLVSLGFDIFNSYLVYNDPEMLSETKQKKKMILVKKSETTCDKGSTSEKIK